MESFGFIILRHVNKREVDNYWKLSYESVRKYYPENEILIIDDNSNYDFLDAEYEKSLYKTTIIKSEYHARGELLPYYYYLHNKLFDIAVIIHDSVFINSEIDLNVDKYKLLWEFEHNWDRSQDEIKMMEYLDNSNELIEFYSKKHLWKGCFGGMAIITYDYLQEVNNKYDLSKLLPHIKTRGDRMTFERIIACVLQKNHKKECLLGNIHRYCKWGIRYNEMQKYNNLPVIKIWSGR
jgi:hypothetical protein